MNLASFTLAAAQKAVSAGDISSLALTEFYLDRIARYDGQLYSFITVTADLAREQAQRADADRAAGIVHGALHGIPISLKDLYDVRGVRTTAGSNLWRENIAQADAFVTERLFANGAVLLGKNNMHEFAYGVTNENPHYGDAHNPWQFAHITGGSSGGSAAAVAARLCLGAPGSDTGGSIRIPAALCGITGLKPTYGRVSLRGVVPLSWSNDHAGPMAQTAEDCALLLNVIAGYDGYDPVSVNLPTTDFTSLLGESLRGLRFAMPQQYFQDNADAEIVQAVREAGRVFYELGAAQVNKELTTAQKMFDTNRIILRVEAATLHHDRMRAHANEYGADVLARLKSGEKVGVEEYALARRHQAELRMELERFFGDIDFFITPTTAITAPPIGSDAVSLAQQLTAFTAPFDVTGLPALSIPCGFSRAGMPIGLQIVGRAWDEDRLLQVAHQFQRVTGYHTKQPLPA